MQIPEKARLRYQELTPHSKKEFLRRYKRLRKEHRTPENSALLAAGYVPEDIKKWPHKIRYMLAAKTNAKNLLPGTAAYARAQEEGVREIAEWLDGWFERNHECR